MCAWPYNSEVCQIHTSRQHGGRHRRCAPRSDVIGVQMLLNPPHYRLVRVHTDAASSSSKRLMRCSACGVEVPIFNNEQPAVPLMVSVCSVCD